MKTFEMSRAIKEELSAALHDLPPERTKTILAAIAGLCAEVEIKVRETLFEDMRQRWADGLRVMLNATIRG